MIVWHNWAWNLATFHEAVNFAFLLFIGVISVHLHSSHCKSAMATWHLQTV